jgi:antirestriction protein ArdC
MTEKYPSSPHPEEPESQEPRARRDERQTRRVGRAAMRQSGNAERPRAGSSTDSPEAGKPEREHVYDQITNRIIRALEAGTVPWQKPWGASGGWPRSMTTGKRYQGVNVLMLGMTSEERAYGSQWWGTYRQIEELGGHVLRGQSGKNDAGPTTVLFADTREREDDEADPQTGEPARRRYTVARAFRVFNAAQCEGLPERFYPQPGTDELLAEPQAVLDGYLAHGGPRLDHVPTDRAYYRPGEDRIVLPLRTQFKSPGHYYETSFHEAVHSTGHPSRLNRPGIAEFDHFGSGKYAREELVAQIGSAMLLAETGIDDDAHIDNSAAYVQSWLRALKDDRSLVVSAASQAYKAVELITEPLRSEELPA